MSWHGTMGPRPFPWGPLEELAGGTIARAAALLDVDRTQAYRWRRYGLTVDQADELACRVGLHPANVWPDW